MFLQQEMRLKRNIGGSLALLSLVAVAPSPTVTHVTPGQYHGPSLRAFASSPYSLTGQ